MNCLIKGQNSLLILLLLLGVSLTACNTSQPLLATSHHPAESPDGSESINGKRRLPRDNPGASVINKRLLPANRRPVNTASQNTAPVPNTNNTPGWEGTPFGPAPGIAGPAPTMPMGMNNGMQPMGMMGNMGAMNGGMPGMNGGMPPMPAPPAGYNPSMSGSSPFAYDDTMAAPSPAYPTGAMNTPAVPYNNTQPQFSDYPNHSGSGYPPLPTQPAPPKTSHNQGMFNSMFGNREEEYLPPNPVYSDSFVPDPYGQSTPAPFQPGAPLDQQNAPFTSPMGGTSDFAPPTTPIPLNKESEPSQPNGEAYPWLESNTAVAPSPYESAPMDTPSSAITDDIPMQIELPGDELPWLREEAETTEGGWEGSMLDESATFTLAAASDYPELFTVPESPEPFLKNRAERDATDIKMLKGEAKRMQSLRDEIRSMAFPESLMNKQGQQKANESDTTPEKTGAISLQKALA